MNSKSVALSTVVAVFAHNEENHIQTSLESLQDDLGPGDQVVVLDNGSTDRTGACVREFAGSNPAFSLQSIALGDKANAWNFFCHDLRLEADLYVFLDGDCVALPGALQALRACVAGHPRANVVSALPAGTHRKNREYVLRCGGVSGNLYAIVPGFMDRLRAQAVRLPIGLIGEDSLVAALAYWNLEPARGWDKERVATCMDAEFDYPALSWRSAADVRLYYRRKIRYSLRHFQMQMLRGPLKKEGVKALPVDVDTLYATSPTPRLGWRGLDTWFDYLALKRIRRSRQA